MLKSMAEIRHLHIHSQGVGIAHGTPHRLLYHLLAYYIADILRQQTENVGLSAGNEHARGTGTKLIVVIADRKSTRLNSSHGKLSRMPSSA